MKELNYKKIIILVSAAVILQMQIHCSLLRETRISTAAHQQGITDEAKYNKAVKKVNQANLLYQRKNPAGALSLAKESLADYPTFEAHYLMGTILYQEGRPDESLEAFYKAENLNSKDPQLLLSIATVLLGKGDADGALARYLHLTRLYPEDPLYYYRAGVVYKLKKDFESSYSAFKKSEEFIASFSEPAQLYLQLADTASELKKYEESDLYYKKAAELDPDLAEAREGMNQSQVARILEKGNAALSSGDYPAAVSYFKEAVRTSPGSSGAHLLLGSAYLLSGDTGKAEESLKQSVSLNPANPQGYILLSAAYHKRKDYGKASEVAKQGLRIAPENAALWNAQGIAQRDSGELSAATDSFYRAVKLAPKEGSYRISLAYAYLDTAGFTDAEREFREALQNPDSETEAKKGLALTEIYSLLNRGDRFLEEGRIPAAQAEYKKALSKNKELPAVHSALGRAEFENKKYNAAAKHQNDALALKSDYIPALQELVRIYTATHNGGARRNTLKKIESLTGSDLTAALTMGRILEDEGKLKEARDYYTKLLPKQKDPEPVRIRLGYVYYKSALEENKNENYDKALSYLQEAGKFNPSIPHLKESVRTVSENKKVAPLLPEIRKADALYERGEYPKAAAAFEEIYKKHKRSLILVKLAESYIAMGQEARGVRLLEEASDEFPDDTEIAEAVNNHLLKKGNLDAAHNGFTDIVRRNESAYYSYYKLGIIDLKRDRPSRAIESFTKALIYRPEFTPARIARGVAYYENMDISAARKEFESALEQKDSGPLPLYNIGVILYNDNLHDKAASVFSEILKTYPDFTDAHYHLSYIYFSREDYESAESEIKKALEKKQEPVYWNALAQIYEKRSEKDRSVIPQLRETYASIITGFPDSRYAAESREKIRKISSDVRFVQPFSAKAQAVLPPVFVNGELVFAEKHTLVSMRSDGKQVKWKIHKESPILDFKVNGVVILLTKGMIEFFDAESAELIGGFGVPATADSLLGTYHSLAFTETVWKGKTKTAYLKQVDTEGRILQEYKGEAGGRFVFSGNDFYEVVAGNQGVKIRSLRKGEAVSSPVLSAERNAPARVLRGSEGLYVHVKNHGLHILNPETLTLQKTIKTNAEVVSLWDRDGTESIILKEKGLFRILSGQGDQTASLKLSTEAMPGQSFAPGDAESLIYAGRDRKVRRINLKGEESWAAEIPYTAVNKAGKLKAAWTLYY